MGHNPEFTQRLQELITRAGGQRQFAERVLISDGTPPTPKAVESLRSLLSLYAAGKRTPGAPNLVRLARAGDVTINWLMGTQGTQQSAPQGRRMGGIYLPLVEHIFEVAEGLDWWESLSTAEKMEQMAYAYEDLASGPRKWPPSRALIIRLLRRKRKK